MTKLFSKKLDSATLAEDLVKEATIGAIARLADDERKWPTQIHGEMLKHLPYLADYDVEIVLDRVEPEAGAALGYAQVRNRTMSSPQDRASRPGNVLRVPIIVNDRKLDSFFVFEAGGEVYPLSEDRIQQAMLNPTPFDTDSTTIPRSSDTLQDLFPPYQQRMGFGRVVDGASRGHSAVKSASVARIGRNASALRTIGSTTAAGGTFGAIGGAVQGAANTKPGENKIKGALSGARKGGLMGLGAGAAVGAGGVGITRALGKTAAITGVHFPEQVLLDENLTNAERKAILARYLRTKAKEEPSGYLKPTLIGAGLGAGLGAVGGLGFPLSGKSGNPKDYAFGALAGAGGGATIGAGLGALTAAEDRRNIRIARRALADPKAMEDLLSKYRDHYDSELGIGSRFREPKTASISSAIMGAGRKLISPGRVGSAYRRSGAIGSAIGTGVGGVGGAVAGAATAGPDNRLGGALAGGMGGAALGAGVGGAAGVGRMAVQRATKAKGLMAARQAQRAAPVTAKAAPAAAAPVAQATQAAPVAAKVRSPGRQRVEMTRNQTQPQLVRFGTPMGTVGRQTNFHQGRSVQTPLRANPSGRIELRKEQLQKFGSTRIPLATAGLGALLVGGQQAFSTENRMRNVMDQARIEALKKGLPASEVRALRNEMAAELLARSAGGALVGGVLGGAAGLTAPRGYDALKNLAKSSTTARAAQDIGAATRKATKTVGRDVGEGMGEGIRRGVFGTSKAASMLMRTGLGAGIGGAAGTVTGYALPSKQEDKLRNTLRGAGAGTLSGAAVGAASKPIGLGISRFRDASKMRAAAKTMKRNVGATNKTPDFMTKNQWENLSPEKRELLAKRIVGSKIRGPVAQKQTAPLAEELASARKSFASKAQTKKD